MESTSRRYPLYRWIGWFFLMTIVFLFLIQLSFLKYLPNLQLIHGATTGKILFAYIYLIGSYITQATLLSAFCAVIMLLITYFFPKKSLIFSISILLGGTLIACQIADAIIFNLYHSHELLVGLTVMHSGATQQVFPISNKEITMLFLVGIAGILIESLTAVLIWRRIQKTISQKTRPQKKRARLAALIIACVLFSYGTTASVMSLPRAYQPDEVMSLLILKMSRLVPYYNDLFAALMPIHHPYLRTITTQQGTLTYQKKEPLLPMHYPLQPLHCSPHKPLPNILFLVIDTWRYDAMTPTITPNIYQFSKRTVQFKNHRSGGNCTESGIFTLFYGIPANYWKATSAQGKGPVFFNILKQNHYQILLDASATLQFPQFNQNVFHDVKGHIIQTPGRTTVERDKAITQQFSKFLKTRNKKRPFFSFVFYDAAHNYCGGGVKAHQSPFESAIQQCTRFALTKTTNRIPYMNRYRNAVHFIDQQVKQVLTELKRHHLFKNTIIVITGDHGEQFNDEKMGIWSHNSLYSPYQLHVPFMIYWPNKKPYHTAVFSTHFDVMPTLLRTVFACRNPIQDYSIGKNLNKLSKPKTSEYLIAGNYNNYAIITQKRITRFYQNGDYDLRSPNSRQAPYAKIDTNIIRAANKDLLRYFVHQ